MSKPRNSLLRLAAHATALATKERRAATRCAVHFPYLGLKCQYSNSGALASAARSFSSCTSDSHKLAQLTWVGSPKPECLPCIKEYNGFKWKDEYSWMDPATAQGPSVIPTTRNPNSAHTSPGHIRRGGGDPCPTRLQRHLRREDRHTRRVLAAVGVQSLQTQLLTELHDRYLAPGLNIPSERLGPYYYSVLFDDVDGSLRAYLRQPAGPRDTPNVRQAGSLSETGRHPAAAVGDAVSEVLLDGRMVEADAQRAEALIGRRLGRSPGALKLCPSHRLLAYTLPLEGCHDQYCVLVRDTEAGVLLLPGGVVGGVAGPTGMELAADGRSLVVAAADKHGRPNQIVLYDLTCSSRPRQLLAETDPRFFLAVGRTKDGALLLLNANSKTSSEVHLLDARRPWSAPPRLVQRRLPGLQYYVEHNHNQQKKHNNRNNHNQHNRPEQNVPTGVTSSVGGDKGCGDMGNGDRPPGGHLVILTNARPSLMCGGADSSTGGGGTAACGHGGDGGDECGGDELHVVTAPLESPSMGGWRPLVGEQPAVVVTDMDVFDNSCVLYERRNGLPAVSVVQLSPAAAACDDSSSGAGQERCRGAVVRQVPLPPWALHISPGINADPAATTLRLTLSSPLHPPATFDLHLTTLHLQLLARETPPAPAAELLARCSLLRVRLPVPVVPVHRDTGCTDSSSGGGGGLGGGGLGGGGDGGIGIGGSGDDGDGGSCGGGAGIGSGIGEQERGGGQGDWQDATPLWMTLVLPPDMSLPVLPAHASSMSSTSTPAAARVLMEKCASGTSTWQATEIVQGAAAPAAPAAPIADSGVYSTCNADVRSSPAGTAATESNQGMMWTLIAGPALASSSSSSSQVRNSTCVRASLKSAGLADTAAAAAAAMNAQGTPKTVGEQGGNNKMEDTPPHVAVTRGGSVSCSWAGRPGPRPALLSVYGAYGMPLELSYDASILSLLERGWAVARVHVRGGGEQGQRWHAAGRRHLKRAGVADCVAAARELVAGGVTAPGLLAGHTISAGGVVLGAALNTDPSLWGAAVMRCAFLELQGPCSDPTQPLAAHEWDEWGDPTDPRDWAAITAACPYGNLAAANMAVANGSWRVAVLASCAEEDPRVHPGIPAKWVAQLRAALRHQYRNHHQQQLATCAGDSDEEAQEEDEADMTRGRGRWGRYLSHLSGRTSPTRSRKEPMAWTPLEDAADKVSARGDVGDELSSGVGGGSCRGPENGGGASMDVSVWCPLLRVYGDGTGHVRLGSAADAEVTEELAFLLIALQPQAHRQEVLPLS